MEPEQYELMFRQEQRHWWYSGMREISARLLDAVPPSPDVDRARHRGSWRVLDAGCGSGGTSMFLERWGRVVGVDVAAPAVALAGKRGLQMVARASVLRLPFADASFDIVTSFDVLYHMGVSDDSVALRELHRVLRPGGVALVRVPAFDGIRGSHDVAVHTRHRYQRDELCAKLEDVGFRIERASYANFAMFPVASALRFVERFASIERATDLWSPPAPLNALLTGLLGLEARLVATTGLPWGLSVVVAARRVDGLAD
jgi:SAM-dependent methyltransferase